MSGEVQWRKSSRSSDQGGNCVEVARLVAGQAVAEATSA
ncbi:DUF397 domain-containing protein [Actinoallomurus acanthiterrae]